MEWEGVRDLTFIAAALTDHKSLVRLNLTHNEVGVGGSVPYRGGRSMGGGGLGVHEVDCRRSCGRGFGKVDGVCFRREELRTGQ